MQTNDNSENENSKRNFIFISLAAVAVAGALGAAFMLGGRTGGSADSATDAQVLVSPTAPSEGTGGDSISNPDGQSNAPQGGDIQPAPTETPAPEDGDTDDATVTPDPDDGGCNFCEDDGDLAPQPTSTPSCAFCPEGLDLIAETPIGPDPCLPDCVADVDLGVLVDVAAPVFEDISTTFCFPVFQVEVEVDAPAEVWFEYEYNGVDYESAHMDAANTVNIGEDMSSFDWGVYLINVYYVHAIDLSGNHAVSPAQGMPDPELC